jgi:hypothetical protein
MPVNLLHTLHQALTALAYATLLAGPGVVEKRAEREQGHTSGT